MSEQNNELTRPLADQSAGHEVEMNPQKPDPRRVDVTPTESVNIGYVGGVRVAKAKE